MAEIVVMPKLGLTMREGTLVRWLIEPGAEVAAGEPICEVETEKIVVEVESPVSGHLLSSVEAGPVVPVGEPIAVFGDPGEDVSGIQLFDPAARRPEVKETRQATVPEPARADGAAPSRRAISPVARRLAKELGVDLDRVAGTGPGGRVSRQDVEAAAGGMAAAVPTEPVSSMRQAIAAAMTLSAAVPQFVLERDVPVSALEAWLAGTAADHPDAAKPTVADAIAISLARALAKHPAFLRSWSEDGHLVHPEVNLGLAVAVPDGLVVPVVAGADHLSVVEMSERRRELQDKAQAGRLSATEMSGSVFTLSNLGPMGVDRFRPLINPPESGILGVGRLAERAGKRTITLTLVADHRVVDGAEAAALLAEIAQLLGEPAGLDD